MATAITVTATNEVAVDFEQGDALVLDALRVHLQGLGYAMGYGAKHRLVVVNAPPRLAWQIMEWLRVVHGLEVELRVQ